MPKHILRWQLDHTMHLGKLRDGVKLQQAATAVCTLAHNARKETRRLWIEGLAAA